jgi:hypothetical protein
MGPEENGLHNVQKDIQGNSDPPPRQRAESGAPNHVAEHDVGPERTNAANQEPLNHSGEDVGKDNARNDGEDN